MALPASPPPFSSLDALPPPEIALRAEAVGETKAGLDTVTTLVLGGLAGAFISLGAVFATVVTAGGDLPFGAGRLLGGLAFSLGLILVVVAGAELFTGNTLVVMAWASRRISTVRLLRNWALVYAGNLAGALATAGLLFASGQYEMGSGAVGRQALAVASAKMDHGFGQAVVLGILCNALVCLAVWLSFGARSVTDRILAVVPPISAFVAAGFEHSVANAYFVPYAILVKSDAAFVRGLGDAPQLGALAWWPFVIDNLLPVTIGNVVGGALLVGGVYWFVYLRAGSRAAGPG